MEGAKPTGPRKVSIWVKVFVLIHLYCIFEWSLPEPPNAIKNGLYDCSDPLSALREPMGCLYAGNHLIESRYHNPLKYYTMSSGTWQSWDMFAPEPASLDIYLDAEVTYRDGSRKIVRYPRMYEMSIGEKYIKERFRKYVERVQGNEFEWKWLQLGRYMAQVAYTERDNPPMQLVMRRNLRYIQKPGQPQPTGYTVEPFSTYFVDFEQLREDKPL